VSTDKIVKTSKKFTLTKIALMKRSLSGFWQASLRQKRDWRGW